MLETVIIAIHVLVCLGIIGFVLLQHGKGADMGASFGSGASGTVFGSEGSANFLSRTTAIMTAIFFITSIGLAYYADKKSRPAYIEPIPATQQQPASQNTNADLLTPTPAVTTDATNVQQPVIENSPAPAGNAPVIQNQSVEVNSTPIQTNATQQPAAESQPTTEGGQ